MICSKARKLLGLLYRQFYNHATTDTIKQLYVSLIRPHLEYAAPLWDPHLQKDVDMLENVQKFAMKLITRKWDQGYAQLTEMVDLPTLQSRRLHLKLYHVFRIVHGLCDFPSTFHETSSYCGDVPDLTYFTSPLLEQTHSYTHLYLVVQLHGINSQRSKLL